MQDLLEALRPGLVLHDSYEDAAAAVEALEVADAAAARKMGGLAAIAEDEDNADEGEESGSDERSSAAGSDDEGEQSIPFCRHSDSWKPPPRIGSPHDVLVTAPVVAKTSMNIVIGNVHCRCGRCPVLNVWQYL